MERFAIIGFGCAGCHALEEIRRAGSNAEVDVCSVPASPRKPHADRLLFCGQTAL